MQWIDLGKVITLINGKPHIFLVKVNDLKYSAFEIIKDYEYGYIFEESKTGEEPERLHFRVIIPLETKIKDVFRENIEYLHNQAIQYGLHAVGQNIDKREFILTDKGYELYKERPKLKGQSLKQALLKFILDVCESEPDVGVSFFDLMDNFNSNPDEINKWIGYLKDDAQFIKTKRIVRPYRLNRGMRKAFAYIINPDKRSQVIEEISSIRSEDMDKPNSRSNGEKWDLFLCHASEDKGAFVNYLASELINQGVSVWYDDFCLKVGYSLRESIESGLRSSKFGIVVLSHAFFSKDWPQKELNALGAQENDGTRKILPIWLNVTKEDVLKYSPLLADVVALNSHQGIAKIVEEIKGRLGKSKSNS